MACNNAKEKKYLKMWPKDKKVPSDFDTLYFSNIGVSPFPQE